MKISTILLMAFFLLPNSLKANDSIESNPVYLYYKGVVSAAQSDVALAAAKVDASIKQRDRIRSLVDKHAATLTDLDDAVFAAEQAVAKKELAETLLAEKEIFFQIAKNRLSLGVEMPICGVSW
jgi:hypothetical protein